MPRLPILPIQPELPVLPDLPDMASRTIKAALTDAEQLATITRDTSDSQLRELASQRFDKLIGGQQPQESKTGKVKRKAK